MSENNPTQHELIVELGRKLNIPLAKIKMAADKVGYNAGSIKTYLDVRWQAISRRHADGRCFTPEEYDAYAIQVGKNNPS